MDEKEIIADLINVMEEAIRSGDWIVDGACSPSSAMDRAEHFLRGCGYVRNSISEEFVEDISR